MSTRKPTHTTMMRVAALGTTVGKACSKETVARSMQGDSAQGAEKGSLGREKVSKIGFVMAQKRGLHCRSWMKNRAPPGHQEGRGQWNGCC